MYTQPSRFALHRKRAAAGNPAAKRMQTSVALVGGPVRRPRPMRPISSGLDLRSFRQSQLLRICLRQQLTAATTAGGLVQSIYGNGQDPSGASNWAATKAMYDSYRVRAVSVTVNPIYNSAATGGASFLPPLMSFFDEDSSGVAMSAISQATCMAYDTVRVHPGDQPIKRFFRLPIPAQSVLGKPAGWLDTSVAAPATQGWSFNGFQSTGIAVGPWAVVTIEFFIEFHNHI